MSVLTTQPTITLGLIGVLTLQYLLAGVVYLDGKGTDNTVGRDFALATFVPAFGIIFVPVYCYVRFFREKHPPS